MEKIRELYNKYHEQITYIFYGGLTTAVNFLVYSMFTRAFFVEEFTSQVIAWITAVLFAFFVNKFRVFRSNGTDNLAGEFLGFLGARILSGIIENGGFYVFVKVLFVNDFAVKIALAVFVVIVNYVLSKFLIFKK